MASMVSEITLPDHGAHGSVATLAGPSCILVQQVILSSGIQGSSVYVYIYMAEQPVIAATGVTM